MNRKSSLGTVFVFLGYNGNRYLCKEVFTDNIAYCSMNQKPDKITLVNLPNWRTTSSSKLYYSVSEVAEMYNISEVTIRYWEQEGALQVPRYKKGGARYYGRPQLEVIDKLYFLIYAQGLTLKAAKRNLKAGSVNARYRMYNMLCELKKELEETNDLLGEILHTAEGMPK